MDDIDHSGDGATPRRRAGTCGCLAGVAVLVFVGLPLLFLYSFGLSPCEHGPCDPNGASRLGNVAIIVALLAAAVGLGVWALVRRAGSR